MLDDLRRSTESGFDDQESGEASFTMPDSTRPERKILGMTAVERMFLALFLFMNVLILGLALLLATGRIVL
ncbi:MAG: hypothetical protein IAE89_05345 [Anaerolineae bacterium]|nr:hypothetical protein [Anaerolineae bacterium]